MSQKWGQLHTLAPKEVERVYHETFPRILRILGKGIYAVTASLLDDTSGYDFYFWPGYQSILNKGVARRVTLESKYDGQKLACGLANPKTIHSEPNVTGISYWFHQILNTHPEDNTSRFTPGSTHLWAARQPSFGSHPLNILSIELNDGLKDTWMVADAKNRILRIGLQNADPSKWGEQVAKAINESSHLKTSYIWPVPLPPALPITREIYRQGKGLSEEQRSSHHLRCTLYSIWLASVFLPGGFRQDAAWFKACLTAIPEKGFSALRGRILEGTGSDLSRCAV